MAEAKAKISIDNSVEEIVSLDKAGNDLMFDSKPGRFKELTEEEVKQLSARNRTRYHVSRETWMDRVAEEPVEEAIGSVEAKGQRVLVKAAGGYKLNPDGGSSVGKLDILETSAGIKKEDLYYARAEDVEDEVARGANVVENGVKTRINGTGKGVHKITRRGYDELVLMHRKDRNRVQAEEANRRIDWIQGDIEASQQALADRIPGEKSSVNFRDSDANFTPISAE